MICDNCQSQMRRSRASKRAPYHYTECGLGNVYLAGLYVRRCGQCGQETPEIPHMIELHDRIGDELVTKPTILEGPEIRFLRKNLGLRAADLAEFLETSAVSVSRWETGEQLMSKENDKLLRYFYVRFKEDTSKRMFREQLVQRLSHIEHEPKSLIMNIMFGRGGKMSTELVEAAA